MSYVIAINSEMISPLGIMAYNSKLVFEESRNCLWIFSSKKNKLECTKYKNGIYFHYLSVDLTIVGLRDAAVFVPKRYWMSKNRLLNCNLSIFEGRLKRLVRSKRPYNITSLWRLLQRTNMRLKNGLIASHHNFYQIHMGQLFRSKTPLR